MSHVVKQGMKASDNKLMKAGNKATSKASGSSLKKPTTTAIKGKKS